MHQERGERLAGDNIIDIIEHVNEDHATEMLHCVHAFSMHKEATSAVLNEIYENGMLFAVDGAEVWIPFLRPEAAENTPPGMLVRHTVGEAIRALGLERPERVTNWTLERSEILGGMIRLHLVGEEAPTDWRPSFACRWNVEGEEHGRHYTIRKIDGRCAWVDIYLHDGAGARWAQNLQTGATVVAHGEYTEHFPDFSAGTTILLGDETALPTIAALLDDWAGQAVHVLLEVDDTDGARRYLANLPSSTTLQIFPKGKLPLENIEEALFSLLETENITAIWGAGEVKSAARLRKRLRASEFSVKHRVVGYWRQ